MIPGEFRCNVFPFAINVYQASRQRIIFIIAVIDHSHHSTDIGPSTIKSGFDKVDLIISPSTGTAAPLAGAEMIETTMRLARLTYGWSAAGLPALSIPCGFTKAGLPAGVQLAAPLFGERLLLAAGAAYQGVTDWHEQEPEFTKTTPCAHES